jgi:hypothetical protein
VNSLFAIWFTINEQISRWMFAPIPKCAGNHIYSFGITHYRWVSEREPNQLIE